MRIVLDTNMSSCPQIKQYHAEDGDALRFLLDRIDYERMRTMPYDAGHMGLDRMVRLLDLLGHPERAMPVVHVAGTKGKGSTSAMIAAALTAAGYRTGLFTSPHLERVEERMAVDGRPCPAEEFVELVRAVRPAVEAMDAEQGLGARGQGSGNLAPTYFEIITAVALLHFAQSNVDAAVLEVGLGGRLDATNACTPTICIITSISFDHTRQLGDTLAAIAWEKAGIIKPGVPVVSGVVAAEPQEVIRAACRERQCRLLELGPDFGFEYAPPRHLERAPSCGRLKFRCPTCHGGLSRDGPAATAAGTAETTVARTPYDVSLPGSHQAANAAVALAAIEELRRAGWTIPDESVRRGLAELTWPARVEVAARRPTVVLDAAHNVASAKALVDTLTESFSAARRLLVFAGTEEKDHRGMLKCLLLSFNKQHFNKVIFTRYLDNPRAVPPQRLERLATGLTGWRYPTFDQPAEAWKAACQWAGPDDLICVTGSFFIAAEMRRQLQVPRPKT